MRRHNMLTDSRHFGWLVSAFCPSFSIVCRPGCRAVSFSAGKENKDTKGTEAFLLMTDKTRDKLCPKSFVTSAPGGRTMPVYLKLVDGVWISHVIRRLIAIRFDNGPFSLWSSNLPQKKFCHFKEGRGIGERVDQRTIHTQPAMATTHGPDWIRVPKSCGKRTQSRIVRPLHNPYGSLSLLLHFASLVVKMPFFRTLLSNVKTRASQK